MTLTEALKKAEDDFNYFRTPRTGLEKAIYERAKIGTPGSIVYKDLDYIVFELGDFYIYTFYGTHTHEIDKIFQKYMDLLEIYNH